MSNNLQQSLSLLRTTRSDISKTVINSISLPLTVWLHRLGINVKIGGRLIYCLTNPLLPFSLVAHQTRNHYHKIDCGKESNVLAALSGWQLGQDREEEKWEGLGKNTEKKKYLPEVFCSLLISVFPEYRASLISEIFKMNIFKVCFARSM